jgi:hypothetical protein
MLLKSANYSASSKGLLAMPSRHDDALAAERDLSIDFLPHQDVIEYIVNSLAVWAPRAEVDRSLGNGSFAELSYLFVVEPTGVDGKENDEVRMGIADVRGPSLRSGLALRAASFCRGSGHAPALRRPDSPRRSRLREAHSLVHRLERWR